jgi:hypothetical protein
MTDVMQANIRVAENELLKTKAKMAFGLISVTRAFYYRCYKEARWYNKCFFARRYKKYAKICKAILNIIDF